MTHLNIAHIRTHLLGPRCSFRSDDVLCCHADAHGSDRVFISFCHLTFACLVRATPPTKNLLLFCTSQNGDGSEGDTEKTDFWCHDMLLISGRKETQSLPCAVWFPLILGVWIKAACMQILQHSRGPLAPNHWTFMYFCLVAHLCEARELESGQEEWSFKSP